MLLQTGKYKYTLVKGPVEPAPEAPLRRRCARFVSSPRTSVGLHFVHLPDRMDPIECVCGGGSCEGGGGG